MNSQSGSLQTEICQPNAYANTAHIGVSSFPEVKKSVYSGIKSGTLRSASRPSDHSTEVLEAGILVFY